MKVYYDDGSIKIRSILHEDAKIIFDTQNSYGWHPVMDTYENYFSEQEKGSLSSALWVKPRRWWHNRWKNRLCYSDSLVSTFVHSFHAKIVKPDHFRRII